MNNIEIFFERPLLLLLLIPALALILAPFLALPAHRKKSVKKIVPVVLHCIIVLLLCLILSGFTLIRVTNEQAVLLLVDLSYSTEQVQKEITRHTEELLTLIDQNTPVGVVAFGADQIYDLKLEQNSRTLQLSDPLGNATDLEGALDYLLEIVPEDQACRVILLSDGKQNAGQAEDAAYRLAEQNIRVDALYFDSTATSNPEMQISSFSAPVGAWEKENCHLSCQITSNGNVTAKLELYADDQLLSEQSVALKKGSVPVVFSLENLPAGTHTYRVELVAPKGSDTIAQNNSAVTALTVSGKQRLLVLCKKRYDAIAGWDKVVAAKESGEVISGVVSDVVKGGVVVFYEGMRVFVPASQATLSKTDDLEALKGTEMKFRIIEIGQRRRVIGSARSVLREARNEAEEKFWANIAVGDRFTGAVKSITG